MIIRQDIQFLRGLAVLIVVLFHLQIPFFKNGFLGVDIFFVISGFLMARLYDKGTIFDFYKRRLDRLYPAYATTIIFTLVVCTFATLPVDFNQVFEQCISSSLFASNIYYWNQNSYFDKAAFNPLLNLWSLALEVQFYLLVPFLYPLIKRRKRLFFLVFIVSLISCFAVQTVSPKTSFFQMPFRIWEFLVGAYVAWWSKTKIAPPLEVRGYSSIVVCTLVGSLFLLKLKPDVLGTILYGHPALPAFIVTILTGTLIQCGISDKVLNGFVGRCLVKLGDFSYSVYLTHFPVIVLVNYIPFGGTRLAVGGNFKLCIVLVLIVLVSAMSYVFVEKKYSGRLNSKSARTFIFVVTVLSPFGFLALNLSQYSLRERNIFSAWTDRDTYRCGKLSRILHPFDIVCMVGSSNGGKSILLIGDSHADAIKKVFADQALLHGVSTFFVVSNNPLLEGGPDAEQLIQVAVNRGIKNLVSHYSMHHYSDKKFCDQLVKLAGIARSKGIKICIIAPVPAYDVHVPQAMFLGLNDKKDLSMTKERHLQKTVSFRELVAAFKVSGSEVFDPSELLCSADGLCLYSSDDSRPYYFDSNHLTLTGSSLLKPLFERIFDYFLEIK